MNSLPKIWFFIVLLLPAQLLLAQGKEIINSNQTWLDYRFKLKANENLTIKLYNSFRWKDVFGEQTKWLNRFAVSQHIEDGFSLGAGLTHGLSYDDKQVEKQEFRPFQEISIKQGIKNRIVLKQRVRVEERFFRERVDGEYLDQYSFNYRFRYRFESTINLIKGKDGSYKKPLLSLTIGDEIFINAGDEIVTRIFDQNRFFAFLKFKLNKNFSIRAAYASRFKSTSTPGSFKRANIFALSLNHSFKI